MAAVPRNNLSSQARRRRTNDRAIIVSPLAQFSDAQLQDDVKNFVQHILNVDYDKLLRAARVAKDVRLYDEVSRATDPEVGKELPVQLTDEEKHALRRERDVPLSERGMWPIILTVSLAAFLQGHVQSSLNGGALYGSEFGLDATEGTRGQLSDITEHDWQLGAANASPFLFAAILGCPLALPINHYLGRRGGIAVASFLIMVTSISSAFAGKWYHLFVIRIINGIGMGIKAVSTPILASETAVGFWRGTSILAWQLWVACGIAVGFACNLIFYTADDQTAFALIMGAPLVPSLVLLILVIWFCDESPRYLLRESSPNYNPQKAYENLRKLGRTELQALRDIYLIKKSVDQEEYTWAGRTPADAAPAAMSFTQSLSEFLHQYYELFKVRRLRNALISSSIVALAQQLCGINVLAFYSGTLFSRAGAGRLTAMLYSLGFGLVNFVFCLPAIRTIDTLGRRKWLNLTLPVMAVLMACAAASFSAEQERTRMVLLAVFLFLFAAAYSPGMGPIPFTVASESFPLSHREAGAAFAIAVNLGFAGLLSLFFPSIHSGLGDPGALALFSGFNVVAFVLVFLLLEETKRRSLEDLDLVFAVSKRKFVEYQIMNYLPWLFRRYVLWQDVEKESLYLDLIWGKPEAEPSPGEGQWRDGNGDGVRDPQWRTPEWNEMGGNV